MPKRRQTGPNLGGKCNGQVNSTMDVWCRTCSAVHLKNSKTDMIEAFTMRLLLVLRPRVGWAGTRAALAANRNDTTIVNTQASMCVAPVEIKGDTPWFGGMLRQKLLGQQLVVRKALVDSGTLRLPPGDLLPAGPVPDQFEDKASSPLVALAQVPTCSQCFSHWSGPSTLLCTIFRGCLSCVRTLI
jgi:hypothetical protein